MLASTCFVLASKCLLLASTCFVLASKCLLLASTCFVLASESVGHFIWEPKEYDGRYSEMNTGWWWREVAARTCASVLGLLIMPIIFFMDASHPDWRQGADLKPIIVACGNYIGKVCRSRKGKRCIGYYPVLKVNGKYKNKSLGRKKIERQLYQFVLSKLMQSITKVQTVLSYACVQLTNNYFSLCISIRMGFF